MNVIQTHWVVIVVIKIVQMQYFNVDVRRINRIRSRRCRRRRRWIFCRRRRRFIDRHVERFAQLARQRRRRLL